MKKDVPFVWDEACHNAFESTKKYLANPPILGAPMAGKPLILYITTQEWPLGALLAQENEKNKERALYYLSQTLTKLLPNRENLSCFNILDKKAKTLHAGIHGTLNNTC